MSMRKHLLAVAAAATGVLVVLPIAAATASPSAGGAVLTIRKAGGTAVKRGAILKAGLVSGSTATFFTPGTTKGVTCKSSSFTDKVIKNPPAGQVATESLTAQSFGSCKVAGVAGATSVKKVSVVGLPYKVTVSGKGSKPVVISKARTKLTLGTIVGTLTCTYGASSVKGTASNIGQVIKFRSQTFTLISGSSACLKKGSFSATFGPVKDTSVKGSPHVFVN
jgi:hypothetical protein